MLTFSETLNANHPGTGRKLDASDFSVSVDGTANTVTAFAIAGSKVTLTLTDAVAADATGVTVSYTQTGSRVRPAQGPGAEFGQLRSRTRR